MLSQKVIPWIWVNWDHFSFKWSPTFEENSLAAMRWWYNYLIIVLLSAKIPLETFEISEVRQKKLYFRDYSPKWVFFSVYYIHLKMKYQSWLIIESNIYMLYIYIFKKWVNNSLNMFFYQSLKIHCNLKLVIIMFRFWSLH